MIWEIKTNNFIKFSKEIFIGLKKQLGKLVIISNEIESNLNCIVSKYEDINIIENDSLGSKIHYLKNDKGIRDFICLKQDFIDRLFDWNKKRIKYIHKLKAQENIFDNRQLADDIRVIVEEGKKLNNELLAINNKLHTSSNGYLKWYLMVQRD